MVEISCLQIDAFTDRPFSGNPAAVCLLEHERDSQWMQAVARRCRDEFVGDGFRSSIK
jgi:predicted PhzF superfamily epimerase YddE/YHI9